MKQIIFLSIFLTSLILAITEKNNDFLNTCFNGESNKKVTAVIAPQIKEISPQQGAFNTIVAIKGSGFSNQPNENVVQINGMNALVQAANLNQLTVIVPKGAGTGNVTVNVNGKSVTGPVFTYIYTTTVSTFPKLLNKSISGITGTASSGTGPLFPAVKHIAYDKNGNTYLTDGNRVKVVGIAGAVTYLAGSDDFKNPTGIAVDANGNVFVADAGNFRICKITPNGETKTFVSFYDAEFGPLLYPSGLSIDLSGNLYSASAFYQSEKDYIYNTIITKNTSSKYSWMSRFENLSNNGIPLADSINAGTAIDGLGNVYVASRWNHCIYKVSPTGDTKIIAGTKGIKGFKDGSGINTKFSYPEGIALDSKGNVYVADPGNNRIRKISPDGMVTTVAGTGITGYVDGIGATSQFSGPRGIVITPLGILVTDPGNQRVRLIVSE